MSNTNIDMALREAREPVERYKVSFTVFGRDLDGSDVLDCLEDFIAPECAARLECFYVDGSPCVEAIS